MRIIFMGTPDFAVPALAALVAAGHEIAACYTQPPRPAGRGKQLAPSPVQRAAEALGVPVHYPPSLRDAAVQGEFAAHAADIAVVAAYGLILPQAVLDTPRLGCLNIHASLLPRWRGAAPVQRALLAGDAETGITIMKMDAGLDTGAMLAAQRCRIGCHTSGELTGELADIGAALLVTVLADFSAFPQVAQPLDGVTYARKIDKAEARIDFTSSAEQVERQIRAFAPSPGAFFVLDGERFRVLAGEVSTAQGTPGTTLDDSLTIACGQGAIRVTAIQRAGRPAMAAAALLRGRPIGPGTGLL